MLDRRRLHFLVPAVLAALAHNVVHEGLHFLLARSLGEGVREFRFLTNGWLTSQVVYATPVAERTGFHWLAIAWLPALGTTGLGYLVYANRGRLLTRRPLLNALVWYVGVLFLIIDPLYFGLLSLAVAGSDVEAASAVGWSVWPVRVVALGVLLFDSWLVWRWRRESSARPERYLA